MNQPDALDGTLFMTACSGLGERSRHVGPAQPGRYRMWRMKNVLGGMEDEAVASPVLFMASCDVKLDWMRNGMLQHDFHLMHPVANALLLSIGGST